jgi:hypothetical protein
MYAQIADQRDELHKQVPRRGAADLDFGH